MNEGEQIQPMKEARPSPAFTGLLDHLVRQIERDLGLPAGYVYQCGDASAVALALPLPRKMTGRMPSVCSYCGDTYAHKPCVPEMDGKASHGVCPACYPAAMAAVESDVEFSCALKFGRTTDERTQP